MRAHLLVMNVRPICSPDVALKRKNKQNISFLLGDSFLWAAAAVCSNPPALPSRGVACSGVTPAFGLASSTQGKWEPARIPLQLQRLKTPETAAICVA